MVGGLLIVVVGLDVARQEAVVGARGVQHAGAADLGSAADLGRGRGTCPLPSSPRHALEAYAADQQLRRFLGQSDRLGDGELYGPAVGGTHLGFKPEHADCERCGRFSGWGGPFVWQSAFVRGADSAFRYHYSYNYLWNAGVGQRAFWAARAAPEIAAGSCPQPYVKAPKVAGAKPHALAWTGVFADGREMQCALPAGIRFLGEACSHKADCSHLSSYLDLTCAPTRGADRPQCMHAEEAVAMGTYTAVGAQGGCSDAACHGNACSAGVCAPERARVQLPRGARATPLSGQCSNCRASAAPCAHPDGLDAWAVDTSAAYIADGDRLDKGRTRPGPWTEARKAS